MVFSVGIVTKRQILQMIPYNNITKIIQLKGKEVLSVLEKALAVAPKESKYVTRKLNDIHLP